MKFAVVGAGAIGAFAGAMLAKAGEDVTLVARGPHLRAMQEHGVRVRGSLGSFDARVTATDDPATIGPVDVVLLTLKAHSLTAMAPRLAPLIGPETTVVSAQNGIPWWYFYQHGGEWEGTQLESVDPGGVINRSIDPARDRLRHLSFSDYHRAGNHRAHRGNPLCPRRTRRIEERALPAHCRRFHQSGTALSDSY